MATPKTALEKLAARKPDVEEIAEYAMKNPACIAELIEGLKAPGGTLRYGCDKVLRRISEEQPGLLYPYFDDYVALLDSENSFIKWGAIITLGNLVVADSEQRFNRIFRRYYAPIKGPVLVTAANIIGASATIVLSRPDLAAKITREILKVEKAQYERKGKLSPECRNVACGQAIDTLDRIFDLIQDPVPVVRFVRRQLKSTRPAVVKKAEKFLKKYDV